MAQDQIDPTGQNNPKPQAPTSVPPVNPTPVESATSPVMAMPAQKQEVPVPKKDPVESYPEPVITEEIIIDEPVEVKPPPKPVTKPAAPAMPAPAPAVATPQFAKIPTITQMKPVPKMEAVLPMASPKVPDVPPAAPIPKPPQPVAEIPRPAPMPMPPPESVSHKPDPVPMPAQSGSLRPSADIKSDVTRILEEIKLPERRGQQPAPRTAEMPHKEVPRPQASVMPQMPSDLQAALQKPAEARIIEPKAAEGASEQKQEDSFFIPSLRTFREDVTALMKTRKVSMVQEIAMQEKERESKQTEVQEEAAHVKSVAQKRHRGLAFAIVVLIVLGILALGAVAFIALQRTPSNTATVDESSLMFAEQTFAIPITDTAPNTLKAQLANARVQSTLTLGAITRLVPVVSDGTAQDMRPATVQEFLQAVAAQTPDILLRAFDGPFFLGIHTIDENAPVIVLTVNSYDRALEGMLSWEKDMNQDLSPLYSAVPLNLSGPNGTPVANVFQDVVVNNFDTRVLRDGSGQIRMLYAFPTRNLLIIAEKPTSFIEALSRLRAERRL